MTNILQQRRDVYANLAAKVLADAEVCWATDANKGYAEVGMGGVNYPVGGSAANVFIAAGASHAIGAVPDPGSTAHANPYLLGDNATWIQITGSGVSYAGGVYTINTGGASFANPSASVGLSTVNGSASTAMRSDAAPPLDQSIAPTWTGAHTFTKATTCTITDAATNTTTTIVTIGHDSSGTVAASFGSVTAWTLQDSTTADQNAANLTVTWATATHASRKARAVLNVYDTSAREILRGEASGTAATIGFLGASAAAQQTGDAGTALVTFGLMSGTPTFASSNITGNNVTSVATSGLATGGTITGTGTITVTAAVKSDQTTGSSTSVAVVPGVQQYHASAAKAWLRYNAITDSTDASYNIGSVTDNGAGDFTLNWSAAFSTANYVVTGSAWYRATAAGIFVCAQVAAATASACRIAVDNSAFSASIDVDTMMIVAFGTQ